MKNIDRLITFSDGVMAIAVTLLVLPLTDRAADAHIATWHDFTSSFGHLLLIFVLSFVVICRYWIIHHDIFNSVKTFNTRFFWLNALWLLSIVLIPFTSELIGNKQGDDSLIIGIYMGSLLLMSYVSLLIQIVAVRYDLRKPTELDRKHVNTSIAAAAAMTLACILGVLFPKIGVFFLFVLVPANYVGRYIQKYMQKR